MENKRLKVEESSGTQEQSLAQEGRSSQMFGTQEPPSQLTDFLEDEPQLNSSSQSVTSQKKDKKAPPKSSNIVAQIPANLRGLRACMWCSLVMSREQFEANGCFNCPFLELQDSSGAVSECTTQHFEGLIAMMENTEGAGGSWVARWQRISGASYCKGLYAVSVNGVLPRHQQQRIESQTGRRYQKRSYQF